MSMTGRLVRGLLIAMILLASAWPAAAQMGKMREMGAADAPRIPPVSGFSEGSDILFLHTEASDAKIAQLLSDMMGSPVLVVPSLADAPAQMLARVFVFTNGITGDGPMGPLGFQPDVFDKPPGDPGYRPLRKIVLVTWKDAAAARVLKSAAEVEGAVTKGEVTTEEPGVVVNMPFLTWPAGRR